jgi:hypothetical protein
MGVLENNREMEERNQGEFWRLCADWSFPQRALCISVSMKIK